MYGSSVTTAISGKPTKRMRDKAALISKTLKMELPDLDDFEAVVKFNRKYHDESNRRITERRLANVRGRKRRAELLGGAKFSSEFAEHQNKLTEVCGVYLFFSKGEVVYIGKSVNIGRRLLQSFWERMRHECLIDEFAYFPTKSEHDALFMETVLICENEPILNAEMSGDGLSVFSSGIDIYKLARYKVLDYGA